MDLNAGLVLPVILRSIILVLFGLTLGNLAWIIRAHLRRADRCLPQALGLCSFAWGIALIECAWATASRAALPLTAYVPANMVIMTVSLYATRQLRQHLSRRTGRRSTDR